MTEPNDRTAQAGGWQLEGNSAAAYEEYLVPGIFEPWADELLEEVALQSGDRALDVGCGTGIVARRAAGAVGADGEIVGLDPNEGMLEVARDASADLGPAIEWRRGEAEALPFPDERFDVVFCQQTLQFVTEPDGALREMHRVLAEGGRLALSVWRPLEFHPSYEVLADALERHVGDDAAAMMRSPFPAWDRPALRDLVGDAGFREVGVTIDVGSMRYPSPDEFVRREAASSPLAGPLGSLDGDIREELLRDVAGELRPYTDDEGVVFPMETYVVTARR